MCSGSPRATTSRIAGVRVGRVENIEVDGTHAKVDFVVQSDQKLYGNTIAAITYRRTSWGGVISASPKGKTGDLKQLQAGAVISVEQTDPSFDVGAVINGFEPLFDHRPEGSQQPHTGAIQSLQGDDVSLAGLIDQTTKLTDSFAGEDATRPGDHQPQ